MLTTGSDLGANRELQSEGPTPVIIFGHSTTSLGVMRALGRRGIPRFIASPRDSFVSRSRWYDPCPKATEDYPSPADLDQFLESVPFETAVLMPCADDWVRAVASLRPDLRDRYPASVADPAAIDTLMDKGRLAAELERLGLPHPTTFPVASARDLNTLPDELFRNALLKPRDSKSFRRRYGVKAFRVRDKEEARARFAEIEKEGHALVVQEFIPAAVRDHYFIEGFVDREGQIRARFARQRIRIFPPELGDSSYTVSIPLDSVAAAWESVDRLFSRVRYRGVFNVEFIRDPRDGLFRLLEINVRPYVHIEFTAQCGVDLTLMAYWDALGRPVESVVDYAIGKGSVDLYGDLAAAVGLIKNGEIDPLSWLRSCLRAEGLIFAWDDPAPGLHRVRDLVEREMRLHFRQSRPISR